MTGEILASPKPGLPVGKLNEVLTRVSDEYKPSLVLIGMHLVTLWSPMVQHIACVLSLGDRQEKDCAV
jgi:hypothetical protein